MLLNKLNRESQRDRVLQDTRSQWIAWASSSTQRPGTLLIHASWMMPVSAHPLAATVAQVRRSAERSWRAAPIAIVRRRDHRVLLESRQTCNSTCLGIPTKVYSVN
jgi:hypothetical protein